MATLLQRLNISAGDNTKWTFSAWVKKAINTSGSLHMFSSNAERTGTSQYSSFYFGDDQLRYYDYWSSAVQHSLITNAKYRDNNAFYHLVLAYDTPQATASDRIKMYVNGEQVTSFATAIYPPLNDGSYMNRSGYDNFLGDQDDNQNDPFSGVMSHVHFTDGTAYDATAFGEYDANGVWKIKTSPSVTYGTNGFFILKDGNSVTDQSGNSNNFTVGGGTLTNTEDSPSNVFATLNPLYKPYASATFSEGNLKISTATGWSGNKATMGVSQGKWYWEIKLSGTMTDHQHGVQQENVNEGVSNPENTIGTTVFFNQDGGEMKTNGTATTADYGLFSTGDIMGVALDMDSGSYGQITIYKNGTPLVSNFNLSSSSTLVMPFSSIVNSTAEYNFGNGYFGTTAVASAGTNASGIGIFEYDVPTGYTALSTKGLNL